MTATEARAIAVKAQQEQYDQAEADFITELENSIKEAAFTGETFLNVSTMTRNARTYFEGLGYQIINCRITW